MKGLHTDIWKWMTDWLTREDPPHEIPLCDFQRLSLELRPGDVLLVEGRSRISRVIKLITQSAWTHSALYVGRLHEIRDPALRKLAVQYYQQDHSEQLLVEALLGEGTRISPLSRYCEDHLRICRPEGLCPSDAQRVVAYALRRLGSEYDLRQLLDLARFFVPWTVLPRRWRSSLFHHNAGGPTRTVCSCLLAEAFSSVDFPILPFIERLDDGGLRFFKRNPRLFTPKDFDYSPYFHIIKYPFLDLDDIGVYRNLPWSHDPVVYSERGRSFQATVTQALALPPGPPASAQPASSGATADAAPHEGLSP